MKALLTLTALFVATALQAETQLTITGVHNCCKGCDNGILKALRSVEGVTATTAKDTVTLTAKSESKAKAAIAALHAAGYAGKGAEGSEGVSEAKVKTLTVSGVHLCCGKCVKAADKAVMSVSGVTKHTAAKGSETFTVEGDFSPKALVAALNAQGLHGTVK